MATQSTVAPTTAPNLSSNVIRVQTEVFEGRFHLLRSKTPFFEDYSKEFLASDDATAVAADLGFPSSLPRSVENHPSAASAECVVHPGDPSSACVRSS